MRVVVALLFASLMVAALEAPAYAAGAVDSNVHAGATVEPALPAPPLRMAPHLGATAVRWRVTPVTLERIATTRPAPRADAAPRPLRWWTRLRAGSDGAGGH